MEIELIEELWFRVKPLIAKKERLDVADAIVAVFDEYGCADGIEEVPTLDKELMVAVKSRFGLDEDEEEDDECIY